MPSRATGRPGGWSQRSPSGSRWIPRVSKRRHPRPRRRDPRLRLRRVDAAESAPDDRGASPIVPTPYGLRPWPAVGTRRRRRARAPVSVATGREDGARASNARTGWAPLVAVHLPSTAGTKGQFAGRFHLTRSLQLVWADSESQGRRFDPYSAHPVTRDQAETLIPPEVRRVAEAA
jgi:hypothetical protein